ncbi:MFS transporter [Marinomonas algicola]|uniref:MFS transporter n=1 Tax=Marinomonas algicola TaxID=2773454 RepID=UPI00174B4C91|nr:MFS transporter [Marinomonas algicola]
MREMPRTATYCSMFIAAGLITGVLGPSLIYLSNLVSASVTEISTLFVARSVGNMFGAIIAGRVYDKIKEAHHYMMVMVLLAGICIAITPFSSSLWMLIVIFAVMGFTEISVNTGGNLMILWLHKDKAGSAISLLHLCYSLGNMVAPLILILGGALGSDYSVGYWMIFLYSLIFPFLLWKQSSPKFESMNKQEGPQVVNKTFFICFMVTVFLYVSLEITIAGWISTYAVLRGVDQTQAAILVTWFYVALSFGRFISVPALRWVSLVHSLFALLSFSIIGTLALLFTTLPMMAVVLILGLGCSAFFPILFSFVNGIIPLTGKLTGYVFMGCGLGAMIIPAITGPSIDYFGANVYPIILLLMTLLLVGSWANLLRLSKVS